MNPVKDFMDATKQVQTATNTLCREHQRHLPHYARNPHSSFLLHLTETIGRCNFQLTAFSRFIDATHQIQSVDGLEGRKRVALNLMVKAKQELDNILGNMTAYGDIPPASSDPVAQAALTKLDASISTLRADLPGSSQGAMGGAAANRPPTPPTGNAPARNGNGPSVIDAANKFIDAMEQLKTAAMTFQHQYRGRIITTTSIAAGIVQLQTFSEAQVVGWERELRSHLTRIPSAPRTAGDKTVELMKHIQHYFAELALGITNLSHAQKAIPKDHPSRVTMKEIVPKLKTYIADVSRNLMAMH